jgi:hypothetical protein
MHSDVNIVLHGLNKRQKEICDMLWACDTLDQLEECLDSFTVRKDRLDAISLIEIMGQEIAEYEGGLEEVAPLVDNLLDNIMRRF